jgi:hypothetical protein
MSFQFFCFVAGLGLGVAAGLQWATHMLKREAARRRGLNSASKPVMLMDGAGVKAAIPYETSGGLSVSSELTWGQIDAFRSGLKSSDLADAYDYMQRELPGKPVAVVPKPGVDNARST